MIFNRWIVVFTGPIIYLAFISSKIGKRFLDLFFRFYLDIISEIYFDNFFEVTYEIEKYTTTGLHASMHFENGPHAKNSSKVPN